MKTTLTILFIFLSICTEAAALKEGFNLTGGNLPAAVSRNLNSVFLFYSPTLEGTASLIKIERKETVYELYFLTSEHVIVASCPNKQCQQAELLQNAIVKKDGHKVATSGLKFSDLEIIRRDPKLDLALIKVSLPINNKIVFPVPVKLAQNCKPEKKRTLFSIGFPGTYRRTSSNAQPIMQANLLQKRWSQGKELDEALINNQTMLETTIDSLPGSSGGPVINEAGDLMGVMATTESSADRDYQYEGNEAVLSSPASAMVRCQDVKNFLTFEESSKDSCGMFLP